MMELADVTDSKSVGVKSVWVQVPLPALTAAAQSLSQALCGGGLLSL